MIGGLGAGWAMGRRQPELEKPFERRLTGHRRDRRVTARGTRRVPSEPRHAAERGATAALAPPARRPQDPILDYLLYSRWGRARSWSLAWPISVDFWGLGPRLEAKALHLGGEIDGTGGNRQNMLHQRSSVCGSMKNICHRRDATAAKSC